MADVPMTLVERLRNPGRQMGGALQEERTLADMAEGANKIERQMAALAEIERITWREGSKFKDWLIECRKIASAAAR